MFPEDHVIMAWK